VAVAVEDLFSVGGGFFQVSADVTESDPAATCAP
jgi:hypothetical protein